MTAETEDLLRRLDAMARRSDELFGEQNPLLRFVRSVARHRG